MDDVLESGYYKTPLGYRNVDWFVIEIYKLENKKAFYFKNTRKEIILTEEDEEDNVDKKTCVFVIKIMLSLIKLEIIVT